MIYEREEKFQDTEKYMENTRKIKKLKVRS